MSTQCGHFPSDCKKFEISVGVYVVWCSSCGALKQSIDNRWQIPSMSLLPVSPRRLTKIREDFRNRRMGPPK